MNQRYYHACGWIVSLTGLCVFGCATPDMASLSNQPLSSMTQSPPSANAESGSSLPAAPQPTPPGAVAGNYQGGPPAASHEMSAPAMLPGVAGPIQRLAPVGPRNYGPQNYGPMGPPSVPMNPPASLVPQAMPVSFIQPAPGPPPLPPEATPPRMDYLQQGATFGPRSLPPVQPTATERMLEMQSQMEQLLSDSRELKDRMTRVEQELAHTQSDLSMSRDQVAALRTELQTAQQMMRQNFDQLDRLGQQLESNERAHLQQLDEIIDVVRSAVRSQIMQAATTPPAETP